MIDTADQAVVAADYLPVEEFRLIRCRRFQSCIGDSG